MPEGEEDKAPWAAEKTSIDWSPWVITKLEVQQFKSEVRQSRLLTEATMQFSGIDDSICKIVSVVGIDWNRIYEFTWCMNKKYEFISLKYYMNSYDRYVYEFISSTKDMNSYDRDNMNSYVSVGVWIHIIDK